MPKEVFKFTNKNCKKNSKVGLLATEGTIKTGVYNTLFILTISNSTPAIIYN